MKKLFILFVLAFGCAFTSCENKTMSSEKTDTIDTLVDSLDSVLLEEYNSLPSDTYLVDSEYCL